MLRGILAAPKALAAALSGSAPEPIPPFKEENIKELGEFNINENALEVPLSQQKFDEKDDKYVEQLDFLNKYADKAGKDCFANVKGNAGKFDDQIIAKKTEEDGLNKVEVRHRVPLKDNAGKVYRIEDHVRIFYYTETDGKKEITKAESYLFLNSSDKSRKTCYGKTPWPSHIVEWVKAAPAGGGGEEDDKGAKKTQKTSGRLSPEELAEVISIEGGNVTVDPASCKQGEVVKVKFRVVNSSDKEIKNLPLYAKYAGDEEGTPKSVTIPAKGSIDAELTMVANKSPGSYTVVAGVKGTEISSSADLTITEADHKKDPPKTGEASPVDEIIDISSTSTSKIEGLPAEAKQGDKIDNVTLKLAVIDKTKIPAQGLLVDIKFGENIVQRVRIYQRDVVSSDDKTGIITKRIGFTVPNLDPNSYEATASINGIKIAGADELISIKAATTATPGAPTEATNPDEPTGDASNRADFSEIDVKFMKSDKPGAPELADPPEVKPEGKVYVKVKVKNNGGKITKPTSVLVKITVWQDGKPIDVPASASVKFDGKSDEATTEVIKILLPSADILKPGSATVVAEANPKYDTYREGWGGSKLYGRAIPQATDKDNIGYSSSFKIDKDAGMSEFTQQARYDDPTLGPMLLPIAVKMPNLGKAGSSDLGGCYNRTDPKDDTLDFHKGMYYHKNPMGVFGSATNENLRDYAVDKLLKSSAQTGFSFTGDTSSPQFVQELVNTSLTKKTINRMWSVQCKDEDGNEYVAYIHTDVTVPKNANAPFVLYDHNIELHIVQTFNKNKEDAGKGKGTISNTDFDKTCKSLRDTHDKMSVPKPELPKSAAPAAPAAK